MKTYRIYVHNNGVFNFQKSMTAKLSDVVEYCQNNLSQYGGYIKNNDDDKILRKF